ncbi:hypothetical protein NIES4072_66410 [Nostoc commune NIES-4072]|uniref:DUF192 domain-containing protein n=1 Tax=Nostoc commune NIES-4072 TaxID=2005467 RepID=A0A2R5FXZ7_NOSCO|nr:DUF192 domain-containing protein [Nostoc commune]BBD70275.1 hypothetical protein NIES4070_66860 [Nostoc commune HK-02]GBG22929.1 hypothetical protein NIES4072_66410 [Nostoc commune NIES-4072]
MQMLKSQSKIDWYAAGFKLLNIAGPIAGVSVILFTAVVSYIETRPQKLPLQYKLIHSNQTFYLEAANRTQELEKGLKWRNNLESDRGMLFNLGREYKRVPFWMHQVKVPLDIIYLKNNLVTTIVRNAPPCMKNLCPIYYGVAANQVLELKAGASNIQVGQKLIIEPIPKKL